MASAFFYGITRWIDVETTMRKAVEIEVTLPSGVECSDHASEDKPTPAVGDPAVWHIEFPNSDDYAAMLDGCAPQLPPASSDIFCFCTRTSGGQVQVCDFNSPPNQQWLNDLASYLDYWFPDHAALQTLSLTTSMSRADIVDAISAAIRPGVAAIPRG